MIPLILASHSFFIGYPLDFLFFEKFDPFLLFKSFTSLCLLYFAIRCLSLFISSFTLTIAANSFSFISFQSSFLACCLSSHSAIFVRY